MSNDVKLALQSMALEARIEKLEEACRAALDLFADDHALSRFDWGKAFLRARDIQELNELPQKLRKAIEP